MENEYEMKNMKDVQNRQSLRGNFSVQGHDITSSSGGYLMKKVKNLAMVLL